MRLTTTLSRYIGRQFLIWFSVAFGGLVGLILLLDTVELMRRASGKPDATLDIVMSMALLKLPNMAQEAVPFAILFGGMAAFWRLARSSEIVVVRSAGVSALQFLLPVLVIAFSIGVFKVAVFNPFASVTLSRFEHIEGKYLRGRSSLLAVSSSGVWLRQADDFGQAVVHAREVSPQGMEMRDVIIFMYEGEDRFVQRIDAATAVLEDGYWLLNDTWITSPEQPSRYEPEYMVQTDLTVLKIQDSFATPASISFWDLPAFIDTLEKAGFSGVRHRLYWHSLLSDPFLLCAMVLFSAGFALRAAPRRTAVVWTMGGGILTGFLLYFLSDVVAALGQTASVPVALAAWTPAVAAILIGASLLIHVEEG
jgi:lipopolysaccharide export system permease protein